MDYREYLINYWDAIDKANAADYPNGVDPDGYVCEKHIPYLGDYDPFHTLNLYYPEEEEESESLPTIIYIHGGGWMYGSADVSERYLGFLASEGYAVMGLNYRLLQYADLQEMISDIFAAMQWLGKYGPARGFDLGKVLVCGDSAGGHLSILTACIAESSALQGIYSVSPLPYKISAISVSSPVAETGKLYIAASEGSLDGDGTAKAYVDMMLGKQGEAAPWNGHMAASEVIPGIKLPPIHIIDSEMDSLSVHTGYLTEVLKENGIDYKMFYKSREEGIHLLHVFNVSHWEWAESLEANCSMLDFFDEVVKE